LFVSLFVVNTFTATFVIFFAHKNPYKPLTFIDFLSHSISPRPTAQMGRHRRIYKVSRQTDRQADGQITAQSALYDYETSRVKNDAMHNGT